MARSTGKAAWLVTIWYRVKWASILDVIASRSEDQETVRSLLAMVPPPCRCRWQTSVTDRSFTMTESKAAREAEPGSDEAVAAFDRAGRSCRIISRCLARRL